MATAYMEEADRFDWLAAMNAGKIAGDRIPAEFKANVPQRRQPIEAVSLHCLPEQQRSGHEALRIPPRQIFDGEPIITARDLTCRFGDFTAVDRVNFTIERGEIFQFLGSNGCGKTTTLIEDADEACCRRPRARPCCSETPSMPATWGSRYRTSVTCRSRFLSIPS